VRQARRRRITMMGRLLDASVLLTTGRILDAVKRYLYP
jgi:hypothetical protein